MKNISLLTFFAFLIFITSSISYANESDEANKVFLDEIELTPDESSTISSNNYLIDSEMLDRRTVKLHIEMEETDYIATISIRILCTDTSIENCNKFRLIDTTKRSRKSKIIEMHVFHGSDGFLDQEQMNKFLKQLANYARNSDEWIEQTSGTDYLSGTGVGFFGPMFLAENTAYLSLVLIPVTTPIGIAFDIVAAPVKFLLNGIEHEGRKAMGRKITSSAQKVDHKILLKEQRFRAFHNMFIDCVNDFL